MPLLQEWLSADEHTLRCLNCEGNKACESFLQTVRLFCERKLGSQVIEERCGSNGRVYLNDSTACKLTYICDQANPNFIKHLDIARNEAKITQDAGKIGVGVPCQAVYLLKCEKEQRTWQLHELEQLRSYSEALIPPKVPQSSWTECVLSTSFVDDEDDEDEDDDEGDFTNASAYLLCIIMGRGTPIKANVQRWGDVVTAVDRCGTAGFYHPDVKLDNMVIFQNTIRLIDWDEGVRCIPGSHHLADVMITSLLFQEMANAFRNPPPLPPPPPVEAPITAQKTPPPPVIFDVPPELLQRVQQIDGQFVLDLHAVNRDTHMLHSLSHVTISKLIVAWGYANDEQEQMETCKTYMEFEHTFRKMIPRIVAAVQSKMATRRMLQDTSYSGNSSVDSLSRDINNLTISTTPLPHRTDDGAARRVLLTRELVATLLRHLDARTSVSLLTSIDGSTDVEQTCIPHWRRWASTHCPLITDESPEEQSCLRDTGGLNGAWCTPPFVTESGETLSVAAIEQAIALKVRYKGITICSFNTMPPIGGEVEAFVRHLPPSRSYMHLTSKKTDKNALVCLHDLVKELAFSGIFRCHKLKTEFRKNNWTTKKQSRHGMHSKPDYVLKREPLAIEILVRQAKSKIFKRNY